MAAIPKILKKFQLFVDGQGYLGLADEVQLPKLTVKTREITSGFQAPLELDLGQLEKLEGSITMLEYESKLLKTFGVMSSKPITMTARGAIQSQGQEPVPVVVSLEGFFKEVDMGNWKDGEEAKLSMQYTAQKYKLEIDGESIYEIDLINDTRIINGKDQLASLRKAIGSN